jgi:hypothetical protein
MKRIWSGVAVVAVIGAAFGVRAMFGGGEQPVGVAATYPDAVVPDRANGVHADVYMSPTCGCCEDWAVHLEEHGFHVERHLTEDLYPVKVMYGIPPALGSCHTAVIDGYVIEGHTPADVILRLLAQRPDVKGIGVPGMPMGSPGMEGPFSERYTIYAFDERGHTTAYAHR